MVTKSGTTDPKNFFFFFPMTGETLQVGSTMLDEVAPGVAADSFFDRHPPPQPGADQVVR